MSKRCLLCGTTYPDALVFCHADAAPLRAADTAEDELLGTVVADRYLVTDLLGQGGMGTVYLARHVRLPQRVAIKVLRRELLRDPAALARFTREAANASRVGHDRVARVYDFGETSAGVVYLAMEYVPGKTLTALLREGGPLGPARAATLVRQIAEALDAAHRMQVVHRDLKPDNVMVIRDADGTERVKVVDFGIAKAAGGAADDAADAPALTRTGFVIGTPEFVSPEQLLGGSVDARSDIYALALVAYECLTADSPFPRETPDRGMLARLTTPPRPLAAVRPAVRWPAEVQAVLDRGLARDPADRFATAGAFARALGAAVDAWRAPRELPVPNATAARPEPLARRRRLTGVAVALAALWMTGGAAAAAPHRARVTRPDTAAVRGPAVRDTAHAVRFAGGRADTGTRPVLRRRTDRGPGTPGHTLDSLTRVLSAAAESGAGNDEAARGMASALHALLPRLRTPKDSGWAAVRLAETYALLLNDTRRACVALGITRRVLLSDEQRTAVDQERTTFDCGS
jgi:serine/threonine-protein kinase